MGLVITKGYLIDRYDYDTFDEILTFINEYGNKFVCFAAGTRRITSKNARSLIYGNFIEMEIFYSSSKNKLSRLKKVTTISSIDFKYSYKLGLLTINDILSLTPKFNIKLYYFYQEILAETLMDKDEYIVACYAHLKFIYLTKFKFETNKCANCGMNHDIVAISFDRHGLICANCQKFEPQFSKQEIQLIKDMLYNECLMDLSKIKEIDFQQLYKKLTHEWNTFKRAEWKKYRNK